MTSVNGETRIGPLDEVGRSILRDGLYSTGELLRQRLTQPDDDGAHGVPADLFDEGGDR